MDAHGRLRRARPAVVLIENVAEPEAVAAITAIVERVSGYDWQGAPLDAYVHGGVPMSRERFFWVGTLKTE